MPSTTGNWRCGVPRVAADLSRYEIGPDQAREIFETRIVPAQSGHASRQEEPFALLLGGQPGSGKSTMLIDLMRERGHGDDFVLTGTDNCRESYPQVAE